MLQLYYEKANETGITVIFSDAIIKFNIFPGYFKLINAFKVNKPPEKRKVFHPHLHSNAL